jgi:TNF receptor-associated factor 1
MKAIDLYVRQLHIEPKNNLTLLNNEENYSEIIDSVNILAEGVSCLHDDNVQMHNNAVQLQSDILKQQKQIEQLKSSVEESAQLVHASQINNNILETELETVKQMMKDILSQSSNDGTFIWKISDVTQKISDAIAERQTSVYSPPFYSSSTGYKMCMRLYFNGDGHARRTHLSLFFVLMRGDYDAILQWPFSHKITFCLYDQTQSQHHIIDSFRPDVKSNSFQRPRSNMNIASGIPKFCPLPSIQQDNNPYVRDDCMFIRCIVDFASTPKTMLPYICSLNPGLPTTVQRTMIQAEIERRTSATSEKSNSQDSSPNKDDLKLYQ